MRLSLIPMLLLATAVPSNASDATLNQRLIIACHQLELRSVVESLRDGANVNARFGEGDATVFQDKWDLGVPLAKDWTAILALAHSSPYPGPSRPVNNTIDDLRWAFTQRTLIPKEQLDKRRRDQQIILLLLLSHKCDIN